MFELSAGEAAVLGEACRTVDELGRLAEAMPDAELIVEGSTGQPRGNPLLDEVRKHRETLARLLSALKESR